MPRCEDQCPRFQFSRPPRSILVVKKRGPGSDEVRHSAGVLISWLILQKHCAVWMERAEAEEMAKEQSALRGCMREAPHTDDDDNGNDGPATDRAATRTEQQGEATAAAAAAAAAAADGAAFAAAPCSSPAPAVKSTALLPAGLYPLSSPVRRAEIALIDFSISLGGDGTVLHLNALLNSLGQHTPIPPLISFAMGTLGFLTSLYFDEHRMILERVLNAYEDRGEQSRKDDDARADGPAQQQQQQTTEDEAIVSPKPRSPSPDWSSSPSPSVSPSSDFLMLNPRMRLFVQVFRRVVNQQASSAATSSSGSGRPVSSSSDPSYTFVGSYTCLNEVLVHRAASPFLASIDIQLLERHAPAGEPFYITTVHGDGLMASTPTGSTAYSMAAGGPLIAPNSDSMVLTPVSPHSLSFRPIILSSCASVRFVIAANSRLGITERMVDGMVSDTPPPPSEGATGSDGSGSGASTARRWAAIASMDGHFQVLLAPGDYVQVTAATHPLHHVNLHYPRLSNESQWLQNLTHKLHWNLTQSQLRLLEDQAKRGRNNQMTGSSTSGGGHYRSQQQQQQQDASSTATTAVTPSQRQQDDADPFALREQASPPPAAAAAAAPRPSSPSSDKQQLQRLSQLPSNM